MVAAASWVAPEIGWSAEEAVTKSKREREGTIESLNEEERSAIEW